MFLEYYGLREQPFGVTPDPRFLYFGATHREALASLFYGIESGCGFLALIAPDLGAIGGNFLRDFGTADHHGRVLHEQANDAAETNVGSLFVRSRSHGPCQAAAANWGGALDAGIMRESAGNNNRRVSLQRAALLDSAHDYRHSHPAEQ